MRAVGWLACGLVGCPGPVEPGPGTIDSGYYFSSYYSSYYGSYYSSSSTTTFGGPVTIEAVDVTCANAGKDLYVYVETAGWTGDGQLFVQQTAAPEVQEAENHTLRSFDFAQDGSWDHLDRQLPTVAPPSMPDESTVFSCDPASLETLTFALSVFDLNGAVADCVVSGEDPQGLIAQQHAGTHLPAFSLANCVVGVPAR